ncbi:hypothetical protein BX616_008047 [Lobosporangium transversale]|uniref:Ricin B lectin domain-containing protein n=1 Tax=Lobosporangium transversale TaxID=64571 RepID=A0A1Y2GGV0_9FUNG|nr:hypothetical protein BCR41DRAFT_387946 [Lobosporangium transversale]XP_021879327.1 hypothetical protein BCR41DRAFT_423748 [Lobosporangium transversale]KAF9896149.1 hypothetical protein BX616_008047 [Lobosporangium transversale]ORZ10605.1 hypothetical protein BCR41DRAFT_387946 [Lobosporangium transversale]ORZ10606.1 hypothetical protein BCR41DRAFT_423748 [Lobosporangium transversale]|eukprot:XP_021879326.1 hypothetical protein BCR41DRAFT_387946 [Lobosporangium transversale]
MVRSVAFLAALLILLQVAFAGALGDGHYRISQYDSLLSAQKSESETPAYFISEDDNLDQVWHIKHIDDDHVTISSPETGRYLGVKGGEPHSHAFIVAGHEQQKWRITQSGVEKGHHNIVYPKQVDGQDLSIGIAPFRIFPPRIALEYANGPTSRTTHWEFIKVEDFASCGSERRIPRFRSQLRWYWD